MVPALTFEHVADAPVHRGVAGTLQGEGLFECGRRVDAGVGGGEPPSSWAPVYARMASVDELSWRDLESVTTAARAFVDPVLSGGVGQWDVALWRWRAPSEPLPPPDVGCPL